MEGSLNCSLQRNEKGPESDGRTCGRHCCRSRSACCLSFPLPKLTERCCTAHRAEQLTVARAVFQSSSTSSAGLCCHPSVTPRSRMEISWQAFPSLCSFLGQELGAWHPELPRVLGRLVSSGFCIVCGRRAGCSVLLVPEGGLCPTWLFAMIVSSWQHYNEV